MSDRAMEDYGYLDGDYIHIKDVGTIIHGHPNYPSRMRAVVEELAKEGYTYAEIKRTLETIEEL